MAQKQDLAIVLRFDAKTGQLAGQVRNVEKLLKQAGAAGEESGRRIDRGFGRARKGVESISRQLRQFQNIAVGVLSVRAISGFTGGYLRLADSYKQLNAQIKLVSGSTAEFVQAQKALQRIAYETHADMGALAKLYAAMAPSLQQLGMGVKDSTRVVELFNKALALSQPTAEEAASATLQFAQAMGSGVLRGEEFNAIMENGRGVALALAKGLGVPVGQLRSMAEQGQLTSEVVIQALQRSQQYIEGGFAQLPLTTSKAWQDLRNAITESVGEVESAINSSGALADMIASMAKSLAAIDFATPVRNGIQAMREYLALADYLMSASVGGLMLVWDHISESLGSALTGTKRIALEAWRAVAEFIDNALHALADMIGRVSKLIRATMPGVADALDRAWVSLEQGASFGMEARRALQDLGNAAAASAKQHKAFRDAIYQGVEASRKAYEAAKKHKDVLKEHEQQAKKTAIETVKLAQDTTKLAKAYQSVAKSLDPVGAKMDDYLDKLDTIERAYAAGIITTKEYYERLEQLHTQVNKSLEDGKEKAAKTAKETKDALTKIFEQAVKRIDDAFVSMWRNVIDGSKDAMSSIRDLFKNLLAELAHAAITRPIVIGISGSLGLGTAGTAAASGLGGIGGTGPLGSLAQLSDPMLYKYGMSAYTGLTSFSEINSSIATMWGQGQYGAALATGAGAYLPIVGGALSGFSKAGLAGGVVGGAAAYGLTSIGAALAGPIGAAVGAALGGIFGGDIAKGVITGITGGSWEVKDRGIQLNAGGGRAHANRYLYESKDGGWFNSSKQRFRNIGDIPDLASAIDTAFATIRDKFGVLAKQAGKTLVDNFDTQVRVSLNGMDQAQAQQAVADAVQKLQADYADALAGSSGLAALFEDVRKSQERIGETISRVLTEWDALNEQINITNQSISQFSVAALKANDAIVQLLGGVQNAQAALSTYYNAFFTQAEKQARLQQQLNDALASVGLVLPPTRDEFRNLVESLDLSKHKAREQYAALMRLSGLADQYYKAKSSQAKTALNDLRQSVTAQKQALQSAHQQRLDQLNAEQRTIEQTAQSIDALRNALQGTMDAIRSGTSGFGMDYHTAQATVAQALANARRGALPNLDALRKPLEVLKRNSRDQYATLEDYKRDQAISLNMLDELNSIAGHQKSIQAQQLDAIREQIAQENDQYQKQLARLDGILSTAQTQVDALSGINSAVMSVADAINNLQNVIAGLQTAQTAPQVAASHYSRREIRSYVDSILNTVGDGHAAAVQIAGAMQQYGVPLADVAGAYGMTTDQARQWLADRGVTGFASGGLHAGGLRLVGENGPELEITGPSRIVNTRRTQELIAGAGNDMARKLDAIAERLDRLEGTTRAVGIEQIKHTQKAARILNKWDYDGQPGVRA